jgi:O-antigen biosynthesis protein
MDLSVIIVNYNVRYFLEQCLQSVFKSAKNLELEVFVVDNNSVDGSVEMVRERFPQVKLIDNKENLGFSKANNQAIRLSRGRYVLLLNPDTVVEDDTFTRVVQFMDEHPDAGGLGVKMLDGQGRFLPESKRGLPTPSVAFYKIFGLSALFPKSRIFGKYHLGYLDNEQTHQVEVLSGAFMLMRRQALEKTGYLDEDFFMYGEDIDLSYRIIKAGYKNYYYPGTRIIHYKGESTKKSSINYVFVFYNAMIIFATQAFLKKECQPVFFPDQYGGVFQGLPCHPQPLFQAHHAGLYLMQWSFIAGLYYIIDTWEHQVFTVDAPYYPPEFLYIIVPVYVVVWLFSVYISGGYDRPLNWFRIVRGIGIGTVAILVVYALLPTGLRFSRALILLGSVWALFSLIMLRFLVFFIRDKRISPGDEKHKRVVIVGQGEEAARIARMLRQAGSIAFIGIVSVDKVKPAEGGYIGTIEQIKQIIEIYRIDEIIFCAGGMSSQAIIDQMSELKNRPVNFKIAPPESLYIIGSNSIDTFGDLFTININAISKPANRRNKRLFDLAVSMMLLVTLPVQLLVVKKPVGFLKNLAMVLPGRRSWVGYHPVSHTQKLPPIKKGVLHPGDLFRKRSLDTDTLNNLNNLYAKEYKIENDLNIVIKGYRQLGR